MMAARKARKSNRVSPDTPVRKSLKDGSFLRSLVQDGLEALRRRDRNRIAEPLRPDFGDSLDIDEAFRKEHEQENRWDYLLGHTPSRSVLGLEFHKATTDAIRIVIAKKKSAMGQLRGHLKDNVQIRVWLWAASGRQDFADTEKAVRELDQNGITFAGPRVLARHMPPKRDKR